MILQFKIGQALSSIPKAHQESFGVPCVEKTCKISFVKSRVTVPLVMSSMLMNQEYILALADVAQCRPANQNVAGSIPSWGTCLCCRPGPRFGGPVRGI